MLKSQQTLTGFEDMTSHLLVRCSNRLHVSVHVRRFRVAVKRSWHLGAKFYYSSRGYFYRGNEERTRSTLRNSNFELLRMSHSLKVPYMSRILSRFSLRGGRGRLFEGGCLFQILSHRRGTNSKRGAYLKLGANSSIYGK